MAKVAPSILSADFNILLEEVKSVSNAEFLHIDVMDGHFVPNISIGSTVYKNLKSKVDMIFDVHIMISDPLKYAQQFIDAGADYLTFHYEAVKNPDVVIKHIQSLGAKAGISIKPDTDVQAIKPFLPILDLVLIMSVEPGFGGQKFLPSALPKLEYLKREKENHNYNYLIEVDGGINLETGKAAVTAGAEVLVAGSFIFNLKNRKEIIEELKKL